MAKNVGCSKNMGSSPKTGKKSPEETKKKPLPKKTGTNASKSEKKTVKAAHEKKKDESRSSCKTPQVMKLVEPIKGKNPVIVAGKSRIPGQLKGREPLSRMLKREVRDDSFDPEDSEVVNITELAIRYEAPQILDRFNACSCEKCVEVFSGIIIGKVPARYARISKGKIGIRSRELYGKVEPMKKIVQTAMIRELIGSRKRVFHDK